MIREFDENSSAVSAVYAAHGKNARNSEGDFIRLKDGRIMFAFSYYYGEGAGDHARCEIRAVYSDDDGRSFYAGTDDGEPRLLFSAEKYGQKNVMSVSLMRMENGDIGVYYLLKHSDMTDEMLLSRSADEGESFYETTQVLPGAFKGYYVVNNCRVERLSDGRIIVPAALHYVSHEEGGQFDPRSSVCFFESRDDGRSWRKMWAMLELPQLAYSQTGLQEPGVLELPCGALYAYMRTDVGCQFEALSPDGGGHWFGPQPSRFTSPCSPLKLAKNPYTGKFYAIWNPIPEYNGRVSRNGAVWGRTPLAIAESTDGYNYDIENMRLIENDDTRGYCYPAVFFPDKDTMLLAYCSGGAEDGMCLTRLTIRRLTL